MLLQQTNAGTAAAAAAAAAATAAGAAGQEGQQAARGHNSKRSSSSSGVAAAAAADSGGITADPAISSLASISMSQRGSAEWQQATAALASMPGSFSNLAECLGISHKTALFTAALHGPLGMSQVKCYLSSPAVCFAVMCALTHDLSVQQAERVLLLAAAWLQCLLHVPRSTFTGGPGYLHEYLSISDKNLQNQLNPMYCMDRLVASIHAAVSTPLQAQSNAAPQQQHQQRQLVEQGIPLSVAKTADAQLVMESVCPQLLPVFDLLQELLLQEQQPGQVSTNNASQPSLHDCLLLFGSLLWTVMTCCILLMQQQPVQNGSKALVSLAANIDRHHAGQPSKKTTPAAAAAAAAAGAGLPTTAALKQQAVQLLGLWEAFARCRVAAAAEAAGCPIARALDADSYMGLQQLGYYGFAVMHSIVVSTASSKGLCDFGLLVAPLLQGTAPGSPEQLQLFHLLCSMLKLARVCPGTHHGLSWAIKAAVQALEQLMDTQHATTGDAASSSADASAGCAVGYVSSDPGGAAAGAAAAGAAAAGAAAAGAAAAGAAAAGATAAAAADPHVLSTGNDASSSATGPAALV
jgi:hypothetical protein